jgi:hypothetical protein
MVAQAPSPSQKRLGVEGSLPIGNLSACALPDLLRRCATRLRRGSNMLAVPRGTSLATRSAVSGFPHVRSLFHPSPGRLIRKASGDAQTSSRPQEREPQRTVRKAKPDRSLPMLRPRRALKNPSVLPDFSRARPGKKKAGPGGPASCCFGRKTARAISLRPSAAAVRASRGGRISAVRSPGRGRGSR